MSLNTRSKRRVTGNEFLAQFPPLGLHEFLQWFKAQEVCDTDFEPRFPGATWPSLTTPLGECPFFDVGVFADAKADFLV